MPAARDLMVTAEWMADDQIEELDVVRTPEGREGAVVSLNGPRALVEFEPPATCTQGLDIEAWHVAELELVWRVKTREFVRGRGA